MELRRIDGWSRREFLGSLAIAGKPTLLGWPPGIRKAAVEPRPETTGLKLLKFGPDRRAPQYVAEELLRAEEFAFIR